MSHKVIYGLEDVLIVSNILNYFVKGQVRGLIKLLLKSNLTKCLTPIASSFQVLMLPTFINWLMNLRKLGQISSPFCILYLCVKARKGG